MKRYRLYVFQFVLLGIIFAVWSDNVFLKLSDFIRVRKDSKTVELKSLPKSRTSFPVPQKIDINKRIKQIRLYRRSA